MPTTTWGSPWPPLGHRPEEAIPDYRRALRLNPGFAAAHFNLGNATAALGRMPEAIGCYRDALRLRPNYAAAHANLGAVLAQTGRLDDAIAELEEAIRIDPGYVPTPMRSWGRSWAARGGIRLRAGRSWKRRPA